MMGYHERGIFMLVNPIFENASHGSLGNTIFAYIRDKILNGEYRNGEKLNEIALSRELHISRTPIREALKQLELEGLVKNVPNRGVYVLGFSTRDYHDIIEACRSLEGVAIQLAIDRMTEEQLQELTEIYDLMEFYAMKENYDKFRDLQVAFHESIYRCTHSQYFEKILKDINYYISFSTKYRKNYNLDTIIQQYRGVFQMMIEKNKALAKEKMENIFLSL